MRLVCDCRIERRQITAMVAGAITILIVSVPAIAEPLSDPATGLAVTPPAGYDAKIATNIGRYTVAFNVKKPDDKDTGCLIGFLHIPQKAHFTQAEINAYAAKPDWANEIRTVYSRLYDISSLDPFEHTGVVGSVIADPKMLPGRPPRVGELRSRFVVMETPKGRTSTACVAEKASFEARRSEFEAVFRGTTPPK
jgi:hypothetical protein